MINHGFDLSNWKIKSDISMCQGYEVVTPILNKLNINWNEIETICNIIKKILK